VVVFPQNVLIDLTKEVNSACVKSIDRIILGLTKWRSKEKAKGVQASPMVQIKGRDHDEAIGNMHNLFLQNKWGDGLSIIPATKKRVDWILRGTDLPRDTIIGKILPRGGIANVEAIAVNLAMAGGRPEYLPVLISIIEAMCDPIYSLKRINTTAQAHFPAVIVNGPIAKQIRLSSGNSLLGPDPQQPAGASIGRAITLIMQNMGGAVAGTGTMLQYGGMRHSNAVFAEDEDGLPLGWAPLSADWGYDEGSNVVTVTPVNSYQNIRLSFGISDNNPVRNEESIFNIAKIMASPQKNQIIGGGPGKATNRNLATGVLLINRNFAAALATVSRYSKADVRKLLWKNATIPWSVGVAAGWFETLKELKFTEGEDINISPTPEQIRLVVAGGYRAGAQQACWMGGTSSISGTVMKQISALPQAWSELLKQAEGDLGPVPL